MGRGWNFTWVINPSLNYIIQSKSTGGLFVPEACIHLRSQHLRHVVVMLAEVRVLLIRREVHLHHVVSVTERHDCSYLGRQRGTVNYLDDLINQKYQ